MMGEILRPDGQWEAVNEPLTINAADIRAAYGIGMDKPAVMTANAQNVNAIGLRDTFTVIWDPETISVDEYVQFVGKIGGILRVKFGSVRLRRVCSRHYADGTGWLIETRYSVTYRHYGWGWIDWLLSLARM